MTLSGVERGRSGVTIGAYLAVMQVLGLERDLDSLANQDPVGRSLQDAELSSPRKRRTRRSSPRPHAPGDLPRLSSRADAGQPDWLVAGGFKASDALAALVKRSSSSKGEKR